ncbi:DUF1269 domain-containing protein [Cellulomonas denverensis]|uniref:DUF1269 domain-containing protein n=1 Tax=Cellulomonas denverensis TaxID=264297 RepID=A0A7X6KTT9_9CELL|nr:DUF1269 domain-containing protein [Cellulomonas denverensis]NKY22023.1 DUF1269 domain-containing protein [Cellulomonas denverensis]GIG27238.1 membrane protein [Cellulomonas denverensis]
MATLSVWKFTTPDGATRAESALEALQKQELIQVHDAATVSWEPGKKKPKTRQANNLTAAGALGGTFWGLLFGMLFFIPLLGAAVGAAAGALGGALTDVGIDDDFIASVRSKVTPGTSALFVLTSGAVPDRVLPALREQGIEAELIQTNLSAEEEQRLREALSENH